MPMEESCGLQSSQPSTTLPPSESALVQFLAMITIMNQLLWHMKTLDNQYLLAPVTINNTKTNPSISPIIICDLMIFILNLFYGLKNFDRLPIIQIELKYTWIKIHWNWNKNKLHNAKSIKFRNQKYTLKLYRINLSNI